MRLTTRLTRRSAWVGLGAALLFAIEGRGLDFSTGGMEAGFNQLAILTTFLLLFERRTRWAAATLGLAVLIRPDGLNLAAAFFGVLGLEGLRQQAPAGRGPRARFSRPWCCRGSSSPPLYFGNFIPQSILAKSGAVPHAGADGLPRLPGAGPGAVAV